MKATQTVTWGTVFVLALSLQAAAAPADSDFVYFVLTSATGEHSFTASYDEFLAWKQQAQNDGLIP